MSDIDHPTVQRTLPLHYRLQQFVGSIIGRRFDHALDGIKHGLLSLTWPDGHTTQHGVRAGDPDQNAHIVLHNFKPLQQLMINGEVGFAESYLRGDWSTDNLYNLFTLIMNNDTENNHVTTGSWFARCINSIHHGRNRNSVVGSQRNIEFHYDLGNDFYKLWLDRTMSYSSAVFEDDEALEQAQTNKLRCVADLLQASPGARVLEIGCGWGAMAQHLAQHCGCNVRGISLSREQLSYAREHHSVTLPDSLDQANDADNSLPRPGSTEFCYQDYRHVTGRFDHVVSIEMFEAVGEQYWKTYFSKLSELLDQGGTAVLQIITLLEERYDKYRASPDFIQRYIFPGGMLPSKRHLQELSDEAGFDIVQSDWYGDSYARTLARWRERFELVSRDVRTLGFDERFMRMWRYYLCYCETGFRFDRVDVGQLLLCKR